MSSEGRSDGGAQVAGDWHQQPFGRGGEAQLMSMGRSAEAAGAGGTGADSSSSRSGGWTTTTYVKECATREARLQRQRTTHGSLARALPPPLPLQVPGIEASRWGEKPVISGGCGANGGSRRRWLEQRVAADRWIWRLLPIHRTSFREHVLWIHGSIGRDHRKPSTRSRDPYRGISGSLESDHRKTST